MKKQKKIMQLGVLTLASVIFVAGGSFVAFADETVGEKVEEAANDTKRSIKGASRDLKEKGCELVNGKMECVGKKVKNKAKNVGDTMEDATD